MQHRGDKERAQAQTVHHRGAIHIIFYQNERRLLVSSNIRTLALHLIPYRGSPADFRQIRSQAAHRKNKTQILGQPNPETKGKKYIFGAHFKTHSKTRFIAS